MRKSFRLDFQGQNEEFIVNTLDTFYAEAASRGARMAEVRLSPVMYDKLAAWSDLKLRFSGVELNVCDTGYDETVEVIYERRM